MIDKFKHYLNELKDSDNKVVRMKLKSNGLNTTYHFWISDSTYPKKINRPVEVEFKEIIKGGLSHTWFGTNVVENPVMVEISFSVDGVGDKSKLQRENKFTPNALLNFIGSLQKAAKMYQKYASNKKIDFIFFSGTGGPKDKLYTIFAKKISKNFIKKDIDLGHGAVKFTVFLMPISKRAIAFTKGTGY